MKFILPAVMAVTSAGSACAQSQVNVSGILDVAARQVSNEGVGSLKSVVSGSNSTSRLIFSGSEDLGGGVSAAFHLEHGLLADTGAAAASSKFWDRRSTVSLVNPAWGELRLGRDFVPSYTNWSRYDPFAYVGAARSANLVSATPLGPIRSAFGSNANTTVRTDNAAQFLFPALGVGLEGGVLAAAGEGRSATAGQAKVLGLRIGYTSASFNVSAATTRSENDLTTKGRFTDDVLGASVSVSGVKLSGALRRFRYDQSRQSMLMLGAVYGWGNHEVKASWLRSDQAGRVGSTVVDDNDAQQLGLGYVYNLSKRTAVFATLAQIDNDGASRLVVTDGAPGMAGGGTSRGYEMGVRHRF